MGGKKSKGPEGARYIGWAEYGALAEKLAERVRSGGVAFDLVVGIARGGVPLAMVIADVIGVKVDIINVKSYTGIAEREKPRIVSTLTEEVRGRHVLVVDDLIDQGDTMETVFGYLAGQEPEDVKAAVLFRKPWSRRNADYCLETVDEWIVFPWERGEASRS